MSSASLVALLGACGPSVGVGGGEGTSGVEGSTSLAMPTSITTADSGPITTMTSAADVTTDEPATTSAETTGRDDTTTGGHRFCPGPMSGGIGTALDSEDQSEHLSVDAACVIDDVTIVDAIARSYLMSCEERSGTAMHTLQIAADPAVDLPLSIGDPVTLQVERTIPVDSAGYEHFAIHDADGELVIGLYGSLLEPDDVDVHPWIAPFELEFHDELCEIEPFDPPETDSAGFIVVPCPAQTRRAAFMVVSPWAMGFVYDGTTAPFGDYHVHTQIAATYFPEDGEPECPAERYAVGRVIIYRAI